MKGGVMNDRRVHARSRGGLEVVRYDRAGKWYLEPGREDLPRQAVTIADAVKTARFIEKDDGEVFRGLPGGSRFDKLLGVS